MQNKYKTMFGQNALLVEETFKALNELGTQFKSELSMKTSQETSKSKKADHKGQEGKTTKTKKKQKKVKKNDEDEQREIQYAKYEEKHHQSQSLKKDETDRLREAIILAEVIGSPRCKVRRGRQTRRDYGN